MTKANRHNKNGRRRQLTPDTTFVDKNPTTKTLEHVREALLGYASMSFVDFNDCGRGPLFQTSILNPRPLSKKRTDSFITTCGGDVKDPTKPLVNLARFEPTNAISVAIERRYVNVDALVKSTHTIKAGESYPMIQWEMEFDFEHSEAHIINGHGRIHFAQTILAPRAALRHYRAAVSSLAESPDDIQLKINLAAAVAALSPPTSWLVAFYDLEYIKTSPNVVNIQAMLASNQQIYQVVDTADEALTVLLNSLADVPLDQRDSVLSHPDKVALLSSGPRRLPSTVKNEQLMRQLVDMHSYSKLWPRTGLSANNLYDWRTGPVLFLVAILEKGIAMLNFLVSDASMIDGSYCITGLVFYPELLDAAFFELVSASYRLYIYPVRHGYGIPDIRQEKGNQCFNAGYASYAQDLADNIDAWVRTRTLFIEQHAKHLVQHLHILDTLPARLEAILARDLFVSHGVGMRLPTNTPILCNYFLTDQTDFLSNHNAAIMDVFGMLDPFYHSVVLSLKSTTNGYQVLRDWVLRMDPTANPTVVINGVLSIIFQHRTYGINKLTALLSARPIKPPPRQELTTEVDYGEELVPNSQDTQDSVPSFPLLYQRGLNLMLEWRKAAVSFSKDSIKYNLDEHIIPEYVKEKLIRHPHGQTLFNVLRTTGFKWAAFEGRNYKQSFATHASNAVLAVWGHVHQGVEHIRHEVVWEMRQEILSFLLRHIPRYQGFWDGVTIREEDIPTPSPQVNRGGAELGLPVRLALDTIAARNTEKSTEIIMQISRLLCRPEVGGVKTDDGYVLAPEVFEISKELFSELAYRSSVMSEMVRRPGAQDMVDKPVTSQDRRVLFRQLPFSNCFRAANGAEVNEYLSTIGKLNTPEQILGVGSKRDQLLDSRRIVVADPAPVVVNHLVATEASNHTHAIDNERDGAVSEEIDYMDPQGDHEDSESDEDRPSVLKTHTSEEDVSDDDDMYVSDSDPHPNPNHEALRSVSTEVNEPADSDNQPATQRAVEHIDHATVDQDAADVIVNSLPNIQHEDLPEAGESIVDVHEYEKDSESQHTRSDIDEEHGDTSEDTEDEEGDTCDADEETQDKEDDNDGAANSDEDDDRDNSQDSDDEDSEETTGLGDHIRSSGHFGAYADSEDDDAAPTSRPARVSYLKHVLSSDSEVEPPNKRSKHSTLDSAVVASSQASAPSVDTSGSEQVDMQVETPFAADSNVTTPGAPRPFRFGVVENDDEQAPPSTFPEANMQPIKDLKYVTSAPKPQVLESNDDDDDYFGDTDFDDEAISRAMDAFDQKSLGAM